MLQVRQANATGKANTTNKANATDKANNTGKTLNNIYNCTHINGLISPFLVVRSFSNFQQIEKNMCVIK